MYTTYMLLTQTTNVTYYMTDPSSRQGERPTTNKPQMSWLQPKPGHESRRGSTPRRRDWASVAK